jgi:hypothetical protein
MVLQNLNGLMSVKAEWGVGTFIPHCKITKHILLLSPPTTVLLDIMQGQGLPFPTEIISYPCFHTELIL